MSDSTPNPPPTNKRAGLPIWWLVSGVVHALLLGWLIFLSPVRVIDLSKKSAPASISPARAQKIMEQVRERQAESLATSVRDLQNISQQLAELEARKRDEFQKFARDFTTNAPVQIEQAQAIAAQAQAEALAVQTSLDDAITNALTTRAEADLRQIDEQQKKSSEAQNRADEAQERALEMLTLTDKRFSEAYQAQAEANAAQDRAAKTQLAARSARDDARNARAKDRSSEIASARNAISAAENDFADANAELVTMSNNLAAAQAAVGQADTNSPQGIKALAQAQKQADSIIRKIANKQNQQTKYAARIVEQNARLQRFQAEAAQNPAAASNEQLVALQRRARELQLEAQQAQATARAALVMAKTLPAPAEAGSAALPQPVEIPPARPAGELERMDVAQLYDAALKNEDTLTESYRRLRATELAMIRQIPLARALELTDTAKVVRPELQPALTNTADFAAARDALHNTRAEINAIHQLASSLLAQARALDRSASRSASGASVGSDNLQAATSRAQTLESLAAEDDNVRAKDLTAAMRRGNGAGKSGSGTGRTGNGSGTAGAGAGSGAGGGGSGGSGNGGSGGGGGQGSGGVASGGGSSGPPAVSRDIPAMPGRTVAARGESAKWMFMDSWYLLGPFDNAGRVNIEKKFPPETVMDLGATYEGRRGERLRWQFHQSPGAKIVPPFSSTEYIIYYAYSELRFEEECDLWVAVGSDDFSKVWINDQLIWASGKQHKDWRVDEGFRKVHFQKGVNRVLYRVENGHGGTLFSLMVGMP